MQKGSRPDRWSACAQERASGMYRLSAFYFARTASDLPMELSLPAGYLIISYFMGGLRRDAGAFFANLLGSLLVTIVRPGTPAGRQGFAGIRCEKCVQM